jgi:predicted SAM-dependent methyltransferase/GT2 family glycosyltransferase
MISIIVPTKLGVQGMLKECLASLQDHTNMSTVEVIVVANGCNVSTHHYLNSLPEPFLYLWYPEALGFAKAVNAGIQNCKGDYIVILNDDIIFLSQSRNYWLQLLLEPFFNDPVLGVSGVHFLNDPISALDFVPYYCAMLKKDIINEVGLLDEQFNTGGCEDIDHCLRINEKGYHIIAKCNTPEAKDKITGDFPIYHAGGFTAKTINEWNDTFRANQVLLKKKWIDKVNTSKIPKLLTGYSLPSPLKLNIGCGDMIIPGWVGVDKYYEKADRNWDAIDLPLPDNCVDEIYSSHLIEHFHFHDGQKVLKEWHRVLKPNGILSVETPDLLATCKKFVESDEQNRIALYPQFFGYPWDKGQTHLFVYTPSQMRWVLEQIGFKDIHQEPALRWTNIVDTCMKFVCRK